MRKKNRPPARTAVEDVDSLSPALQEIDGLPPSDEVSRRAYLLARADQYLFPPQGLVDGNDAELLIDGIECYPALLDAIAGARQSILFETYILEEDDVGERFIRALTEKAEQGVAVYLCYDAFGSMGLSEATVQRMRRAGMRVLEYRPLAPWRKNWGWQRRNHRKIVVIDRCVGFTGGMNISRDYAPLHWGGRGWRDTHLRMRGPIIDEMVQVFIETWATETSERISPHRLGAPPKRKGGLTMRFISNHRVELRHQIHRSYLRAIKAARRKIYISNAYFAPDPRFVRAIEAASRRGVEVKLLLQGKSDVKFSQYAGRALYRRLMDSGVQIYEWRARVLHAKCAVIDGIWSSIGSYNLDHRSLHYNLENNVTILDRGFAEDVEEMFRRDITRCIAIDPGRWRGRPAANRALEGVMFRLRRLL